MSKDAVELRELLEKLYARYNRRRFIPPDPLQFVYTYSERGDKEIAGFISALLAYGRVEQIEKSLEKLFDLMGESPYTFVRAFGKSERKKLSGFKHRFTSGDDLSDLLSLIRKVLNQDTSIEKFFAGFFKNGDENIIPALSKFSDSLYAMYANEHGGQVGRGLKYLLAAPAGGSACKRMNLFLRWMVRNDEVDPGLWTSIDKRKLIVPVDVHMGRLCRILGFHNRKNVSLATAVEITNSFLRIDPADPAKYDFALSRIGILQHCNGNIRKECAGCELLSYCRERNSRRRPRDGFSDKVPIRSRQRQKTQPTTP